MGRREVLVQLDDDLVGQLDSLAATLNTSRSELLVVAHRQSSMQRNFDEPIVN